MNHTPAPKPVMPQTVPADARLDVRQRLDQLAAWQATWEQEDAVLAQRVGQLNPDRWLDLQRGVQIASLRRRLRLQLVQQPLEIAADVADCLARLGHLAWVLRRVRDPVPVGHSRETPASRLCLSSPVGDAPRQPSASCAII